MSTEIHVVDPAIVQVNGHDDKDIHSKGSTTVDWSHGDAAILNRAAQELRISDIPVAFPTETVYGLGADATRSAAVQGIFRAKQRPADNPLIVHVDSVYQLRHLLQPHVWHASRLTSSADPASSGSLPGVTHDCEDPIPSIYKPLVERFWPGPLTMIMPNPENSVLAPEVTAGLPTFGVRMPNSPIALALIKLAGVPLAAPSANASTKPSPTTAAHVKYDLDGRIRTIIDGGPCSVGVESTVVDGLSDPPAILRPGGVSLEELRGCAGWENVTVGYRDAAQSEARPRAPGMKYKHYSPKASVVLHEWNSPCPGAEAFLSRVGAQRSIGIIRTMKWPPACGMTVKSPSTKEEHSSGDSNQVHDFSGTEKSALVQLDSEEAVEVWDIALGQSPTDIARGLFSALRELDCRHVDAIFVEGIDDRQGDVAAAVMNRLRKSAEQKVEG